MSKNIAYTKKYQTYRERFIKKFRYNNADEINIFELQDKFYIQNENYYTTLPLPEYSRVTLYNKNMNKIYQYENICPEYEFHKIIEHSNGKTYYIFRIDMNGYSVLDTSNNTAIHFVPEGTMNRDKNHALFLVDLLYNKNVDVSLTNCCRLGIHEEPMICDFKTPDNIPLKYGHVPMFDNDEVVLEWNDDNVRCNYYTYDEDGHVYELVKDFEYEEYMKWLDNSDKSLI